LVYVSSVDNKTTYTPLSIRYNLGSTTPSVVFSSPANTDFSFKCDDIYFAVKYADFSGPICGNAWGYGTSKPTGTARNGQLYF
jgi:hypothetical protein